jgi:HK97 family phage portal protein
MKIKLPILGQVLTGSDTTTTVKEVQAKTKFFDLLGGLLQFSPNQLSSEKSVSTKIMEANKGWVYRNNDAIAQEVSKIEFELYTVGLSNGEIVYNEIESHPLLDLLDKPNEEIVKSDAIYLLQSHKKLTGNAFWLKIRNGRQVVSLRSLPPDKITLKLRDPTPADPTVVIGYNYQDTINGDNIDITYPTDDVIHFKKPNPKNQFMGIGAVEALAETIDLDNLTTETTKRFFTNGAISNFVLSTEAKVTDDQLRRLQAEMRSTYAGATNAYKTMILGGGLKPVDISYSNKDQEFLGQLEWYRDKIMYGFGNTKASLGMIDDVNRASHEGSIIEWQRNTVKPDMEAIVNTLNEYLVPEFGDDLVLGYCDPVPEDRADDITEVKDLYPIGILTLDEARGMVDLDPIEGEGGDQFYQKPAPVVQVPNQGVNDEPPTD